LEIYINNEGEIRRLFERNVVDNLTAAKQATWTFTYELYCNSMLLPLNAARQSLNNP